MKSNKKNQAIKHGDISIVGDGNIVGDNNSTQVFNVSQGLDRNQIESAVVKFIQQVNSDKKISQKDKELVTKKVNELKSTLNSTDPDLGKVQKFKKFIKEKGGIIASAGLKLLLEPAIKTIIDNAAKKILG